MENHQNDEIPKGRNYTATRLANELGIGESTVLRAEKFHDGVDAIREVSREAAEKVLQGKSGLTKSQVAEIPKTEHGQMQAVVDAILTGKKPDVPQSASGFQGEKHLGGKPNNPGFDKSRREQKKLVDSIVAESYGNDTHPYTIEMLESDIEINGKNYVELLHNTLTDRSTLLEGPNRKRVAKKIDAIISDIKELRRLLN